MPHDRRSACTKRRPDRDLSSSRRGSRHEKIRNVEAGNREENRDGGVEHQQRCVHLPGKLLAQGNERDRRVLVERICGREALSESRHLRSGACNRGPWGKPADDEDEPTGRLAKPLAPIEAHCGPHIIVLVDELKAGRHHPDDLGRAFVQLDTASDHARIGAEALLPQAMAEDGHEWSIRDVVLRRHRASQQRLNTERREELRRDHLRVERRRLAVSRQRQRSRPPRGEGLQRTTVPLPVQPVCRGDRDLVAGRRHRFVDRQQTFAVRIGKGTQEKLIDDGEDGCIATDAEREGEDNCHRESRRRGARRDPCAGRRASGARRAERGGCRVLLP